MKTRNYYKDVFAHNYDRFTTSGYYHYTKEVKEFRKIVKGKDLLELGIGTGCLAELFVKAGYNVEGIEPSEPMIIELMKKNLPIKVYKQDASRLETGKKYDAIFSHGAIPMAVTRKEGIFFDTYIVDKDDFSEAMKRSYSHLKGKGYFMCGVQSGKNDNILVGDFYRNESHIERDILVKTHYFREGTKWVSETVTARIWPEKHFTELMEGKGFNTKGMNKSKTWYIFKKN